MMCFGLFLEDHLVAGVGCKELSSGFINSDLFILDEGKFLASIGKHLTNIIYVY